MQKTIGIIVTYNPDEYFSVRCLEVLKQFNHVVIIDNASTNGALIQLRNLSLEKNIHLIENISNLGLGYALNQGINYALLNEFNLVCTLDQDSSLTDDFSNSMLKAATEANELNLPFAFISPVYVDDKTGVVKSYGRKESEISYCKIADITITSGNLIPIDTFKKVGLFDERLFIDYLDYDFSLRCKRKGLIILENKNAHLKHNLGNSELKEYLGIKFFITHHSVLRRYYITRNRLIVLTRYARYMPKIVPIELLRFTIDSVKILFFEENKKLKILATIHGVAAAISGIRGKARQIKH